MSNTTTPDHPICKNLCRDCEHVLNMHEVKILFGFRVRYLEDEYATHWLCASNSHMSCVSGEVKSAYCCIDNSSGTCERFTPMDLDAYDPRNHLLPH